MTPRPTLSVLALSICAVLGACTVSPPDEEVRAVRAAAEVLFVADQLWEHLLDHDVQLRLMNDLPVETLPQFSLKEEVAAATFAAGLLERLDSIDLTALSHRDVLTAKVARVDLESMVAAPEYYWNVLSLSPYLSLYTWREVDSLLSSVALENAADVVRYRRLLGDFVRLLAQHLAKAQGQAERGIRLPRAVIPGTLAMYEGFRDQFAARRTLDPERIATLEPELRTELQANVDRRTEEVVAGYDAIIDLLSGEYESLAPEAVGAFQYPNGKAFYRYRARLYTTVDLTPEEIHDLGTRRVRELGDAMQQIRERVGFSGSREQFHALLRTDPRFVASQAEEVEARYEEHIALMAARAGDYFAALPKAAYGVRRLTPAEEVNSTFGYYRPPDSIDAKGYYNYNGSRLDERSLVSSRSLIFHELLPGHHLQVALQLEDEALHPYRRNSYFGAFSEGWAEYASSLGEEMGLYEDPYDLYGRLIMDIFLATRLVVDTGIGYFGWSLDEARSYMSEHVFQSDVEIATETLRYATRPGQALAYRLGYEKIWELRRKAERELGQAFDLRAFHAAILGAGNLPLSVLEEHVDWWIERQLLAAAERATSGHRG